MDLSERNSSETDVTYDLPGDSAHVLPSILEKVGPKPGSLQEFSVLNTCRATNLLSDEFKEVMKDLSGILKRVYNAKGVAIIPGSGTMGMEAVAREFGTDQKVVVIRNGWFSYRWTQIFEAGRIPKEEIVCKARPTEFINADMPIMAPMPIDEVVALIHKEKPALLCAPHVETSTGIILPDSYIKKIGAAMKAVGGLFVLDLIASGMTWVDMEELNIDVVVSAPQKGWTGPICCAMVMVNDRAKEVMKTTRSSCFALSLSSWLKVMEAYEQGGVSYHTTMPTDMLRVFRNIAFETEDYGFEKAKEGQESLGRAIRNLLKEKGFISVAPDEFAAPSIVVCYCDDGPRMLDRFKKQGMQFIGGAPGWVCDEKAGTTSRTFRMGLLGLDKVRASGKVIKNLTKAFSLIPDEAKIASAEGIRSSL